MTNNSLKARTVTTLEKAYLFGHYDSRGGSMLILARHHIDALRVYGEVFCVEEFKDEPKVYNTQIDNLQEDFIARYRVIFCDAPCPTEPAELLEDYTEDGKGWKFGVVRNKFRGEWSESGTAVFWRGEKPDAPESQWNFHEESDIEEQEIGEDAFGCHLLISDAMVIEDVMAA
jgi:hypothetical protein